MASTSQSEMDAVSDKHSVLFQHNGKLGTRRTFAHIVSMINFTEIVVHYNDVVDLVIASEVRTRSRPGIWATTIAWSRVGVIYKMLLAKLARTEVKIRFACQLVLCSHPIWTAKSSTERPKRGSGHSTLSDSALDAKRWLSTLGTMTTPSEPEWHDRIGNYSLEMRTTRGSSLFIGALSMTGLGLSIFNSVQIGQIKSALSTTTKNVRTIFSNVKSNSNYIRAIQSHLNQLKSALAKFDTALRHAQFLAASSLATEYLELLISEINEWIDGFCRLLVSKQIDPLFFSLEDLKDSIQQLSAEASKWGLSLPSEAISSVIHFAVSFRVSLNPKKGGETLLLISYPLIDDNKLNLYRLLPSPIVLKSGKTVVLEEEELFLAVDDRHSIFLTLSARELANCNKINDIFCCDSAVLGKNLRSSCLGSLFTSSEEGIAMCRFRQINATTEIVLQSGPDSVIVKSPHPGLKISVEVDCPNATRSHHLVMGERKFTLPNLRCVLHSPNYSFRPSGHLDSFNAYVTSRIRFSELASASDFSPAVPEIEPFDQLGNWTMDPVPETPDIIREPPLSALPSTIETVLIVLIVVLLLSLAVALLAFTAAHRRWRRQGREKPLRPLHLDDGHDRLFKLFGGRRGGRTSPPLPTGIEEDEKVG